MPTSPPLDTKTGAGLGVAVKVLRTVAEVRQQTREWRSEGAEIGCVMTMGALHEGHLSLVDAARSGNDKVISTIFVNPLQFAPHEDFDSYPRNEERDLELLAGRDCDVVFAPSAAAMFPGGERSMDEMRTKVSVRGLTEVMCGAQRPGHFDGVTTEVLTMFHVVGPDRAYFGEKDYQQYVIVRRMALDQQLPAEVLLVPTFREPDGLAKSSRNVYLSAAQRQIAPRLYAELKAGAAEIARHGAAIAPETVERIAQALPRKGFDSVDYVEVRTHDLDPVQPGTPVGELRMFAAVRLGGTRLIDSFAVRETT